MKVDCTVDDIIYDLSVAISIFVQDGTSYVFPHRSLQEYFAASYISHSREETKKEVYTVKFRDTDDTGRITFWRLCEELDQSCLLQYFLIPSLKKYIEDLVKMNDKSLSRPENILFNYLKLSDTHIAKTTNSYFIYRGNARYSIIRYLGIQNSITRKLFISFERINEKDLFLFAKRGKFYFNNEDKSKGVL